MVILGLLLGLVGTDVNSGVARFTFGLSELSDGINFVVVAMGMFGFAEIIANLEHREQREVFVAKISRPDADRAGPQGQYPAPSCAAPRSARRSASCPAAARCSSSFAAYTLEKKISGTRPTSARAPSKASRRRSRPTTPARRPRSFRCSRWAFRPTR